MDLLLLKNAENLAGKRILLRADFNVPVEGKALKDSYRIQAVLPSMRFLKEAGAAAIIVLSHHSDAAQSLEPMARFLGKEIENTFIKDPFAVGVFARGGVFVCENLRQWAGEEKNDPAFAERLASLGDVYVNDAFSASHRSHASIVGLPALRPAYAGLLFAQEAEELSHAFAPEHPFLFVLGGGKPETKVPLIEAFLDKADTIALAGAVANTFFRALGYEIGLSVVGKVPTDAARLLESGKLLLPVDVVAKGESGVFVKTPQEVLPDEMILDVGPETVARLSELAGSARFILWNGPLGDYVRPGFEKGSAAFAAALKGSPARKIAGGGDTVALVRAHKCEDAFEFLSSAGGAMIQFLAEGTLPGIEALQRRY